LLEGTAAPIFTWVLKDITEDAATLLVVELTANLAAALTSILALLVVRLGLNDALVVCAEDVIDEVAEGELIKC